MRRVLAVVLVLAFGAGAAAQTFRSRAPAFERLTMERLRLSFPRSDTRALVFPCQPVGRSGCAANPLLSGRLVFEGPAADWAGYALCRRTDSGDTCVSFERVFEAPSR